MQEACLKAFGARSRCRPQSEAASAAWLYRILYRCCIDRLRARARERDHSRTSTPPQADDFGALADERISLEQALKELPFDQRIAIVLVDMIGLPYHRAAAVLGRPVGTVAARVARGRARLRKTLSP